MESQESQIVPILENNNNLPFNISKAIIEKKDELFAQSDPSKCDIRMNKVYDNLKFDKSEAEWNIEYDEARWSREQKLRVFVVPHSHNDPGWLKVNKLLINKFDTLSCF